jgi:hypothetical protein
MQLTAIIAELRRAVCNLESSIEDGDRARIFHAPHLIVAHLRARRDNLLLTISTLENHLDDPARLPRATDADKALPRIRCKVAWVNSSGGYEVDLYCKEGEHVWEGEPTDPDEEGVYQCRECIANARKEGDTMVVIMCSHAGCKNPAWRIQKPGESWVCESHYTGVIVL